MRFQEEIVLNGEEIAVIRTMTMDDYDQVSALWAGIHGFGIRSIDDSREGIERFLRRNPTTSVVAQTPEGRIIGSILCGHDGRQACFYHVCVHEDYRKQGIGRRLVDAAVEAVRKEDRTISLIDDFLDSIPEEERPDKQKHKRKPTPADAAVDYVSYLLETESEEEKEEDKNAPLMKGQSLIDDFINHEKGKIKLKEEPEYKPEIEEAAPEGGNDGNESYFTETLAKIYIKQGRYEKALEIIQRLNLNYPKKNAYFADQIRFLEKLILNDKNKKQ